METYNTVQRFLWVPMRLGLFHRHTHVRALTLCVNRCLNGDWPQVGQNTYTSQVDTTR